MSDTGLVRVGVTYASTGAVLSVLLMARGVWHSKPVWRAPLVAVGWLGLSTCILVVLNVLSFGGQPQ